MSDGKIPVMDWLPHASIVKYPTLPAVAPVNAIITVFLGIILVLELSYPSGVIYVSVLLTSQFWQHPDCNHGIVPSVQYSSFFVEGVPPVITLVKSDTFIIVVACFVISINCDLNAKF